MTPPGDDLIGELEPERRFGVAVPDAGSALRPAKRKSADGRKRAEAQRRARARAHKRARKAQR